MCGIYGIVSPSGRRLATPGAADRMAAAVAHRGPDAHRALECPDAIIGAHRLRIADRDPRADQPLTDPSGSLWLVCNGEIYNSASLRRRYASYPYRSGADVEVILPLVLDHGAEGLRELDGMFALALWDARRRRLVLARDRAGEKPLFYARVDHAIAFASEVQALLPVHRSRAIDGAALRDFVTLGCVREPRTLFAGVTKLHAGTIATFDARCASVRSYWNPDAPADAEPTVDEMRALIVAAVERQLPHDAAAGVFLSGGLDSGLIAAVARRALGPGRLHTFSVGFPERSYDERPAARRLAAWLGTRHVEVQADAAALARARARARVTAEPIADPALLPTLLLAEEAKRHVDVVLSGEGADELFGGYPTALGHRWAAAWSRLPRPVRTMACALMEMLPASRERVPLEFLLKRFVRSADLPWWNCHVAWNGTGLPVDVLAPGWLPAPPPPDLAVHRADDPVAAAMRADYAIWLRERLLVKGDRGTMFASLEARAPYLDPDVTRAAFAVTSRRHVARFGTKRLLRAVARPWLPAYILHRLKRGLSVPVGDWIAGELAPEVDRLLGPDRIARQGLLRPDIVERLVAEHRGGMADHGRGLWTLLALEDWIDHWGPETGG